MLRARTVYLSVFNFQGKCEGLGINCAGAMPTQPQYVSLSKSSYPGAGLYNDETNAKVGMLPTRKREYSDLDIGGCVLGSSY